MNRTQEQLKAIAARGKVMVSASAGAGKTSVMIQRLADIVASGVSLDSVLAVTFTKKAAAQMKSKLRTELIARLKSCDEKTSAHIREQLGKLNQADISTIHSFCGRLVRTYFYVLDVDAAFEIAADGAETAQLMEGAMDSLMTALYDSDDEDLTYALERLRSGRTDGELRRLLLRAYSKVRVLPDYAEKLRSLQGKTCSEEGFCLVSSAYAEWRRGRCLWLKGMLDSFAEQNTPPVNAEQYLALLDEAAATLAAVAQSEDIFSPLPPLASAKKPRVCAQAAEYDARFAGVINAVREQYKKLNVLGEEQDEREKYFQSLRLAGAFGRLLEGFDREYAAAKREEGKLDYNDLEQYTYSLLTKGDGDIVRQIGEKYSYVFVDEYQDVNPIQAAIIDLVARGDVFTVGDVKQAIYGFRGSKAKIFTDKCAQAEGEGNHIILPDNFRSSRAVIDFVNALFPSLMKPPFSTIDYSRGNAMRGGSRYPQEMYGRAQFWLFDKSAEEKPTAQGVYSVAQAGSEGERLSAGSLAVVSLVARELNDSWYDPDDGQVKRVRPRDICVLTRKRANAAVQAIMRALSSAGYPVAGVAEKNICEMSGIRKMCDVLSYIDNSLQDIPMVSAMLSPLGGFDEQELAAIRSGAGRMPFGSTFRDVIEAYMRGKGALKGKLEAFFSEIERLRSLSDYIGAAALMDEIMSGGGFAGVFASAEEQSAIRRLRAEAFTPRGELSLTAFMQRLRAENFVVTMPSAQTGDSITVMTIHASKGLEFPVVIVADISEEYRERGAEVMPFDEDWGFAPYYYDGSTRSYSDTLLRRVVKQREQAEEVANEINLFYVACTRARYALHVLCGSNDYRQETAPVARSYSGFFDISRFNPSVIEVKNVISDSAGEEVRIDTSRADGEIYSELRARFGEAYPYESGADLPVKSSASRLIRFDAEDDISRRLFAEEPSSVGATGIERGIAYHRFLELCDFSVRDRQGICRMIEGWLADGKITREQSDLLDASQLEKILSMPVLSFGDDVRLYREREFICRLTSRGYRALERGEKADFGVGEEDGNGVIVQGAIDLLVLRYDGDKPVGAHIIDYKFSSRDDNYILTRYAPQLRLYRQVVRTVCNLPDDCVSTTIVNIFAGTSIEVDA